MDENRVRVTVNVDCPNRAVAVAMWCAVTLHWWWAIRQLRRWCRAAATVAPSDGDRACERDAP